MRIPVYITDNVARYKKSAEEFYIKTGRTPSAEEMAEALGIKLSESKKLQEFVGAVAPLENLESTDTDLRGIPESIQPQHIDRALEQLELDQQMDSLMSELSERETNIIRYRYGLMDGEAHTLEETGKRFKLTRERIRQIEKDVMRRLRRFVAEHTEDFRA